MGYRKFTVALAALLAATILSWFAKIGDQVYATVVLATVGAYIAGNVASKKAKP